ncbi:hypothetical protein [Stappia sp. 28M-7]|uniref:hypothetical protein n=1 Tax=Stappia sp. 28M-7 TaxID=2762596 RepID=UPI00163BBDB4|nr:hypothetical protein [Stappia sp. 28M-7]MBC2859652.1 hypothetical protein [Stappia sp. 28M-7]
MDASDKVAGTEFVRLAKRMTANLAMLGVLLVAEPAAADDLMPGEHIGANINEISNTLSEHGYITLRYVHKNGRIEIVARKDGDDVFLMIDAETGILQTAVHKDGEPLLHHPPAAVPPPKEEEEEPQRPAGRAQHGDRLSALLVAVSAS